MNKKLFVGVVIIFLLICSKETYMWEEQIPPGNYWYTRLDFENGTQCAVDFDLLDGDSIDLLFMDENGFMEFQNRLFLDTVCCDFHVIPKASFAVYHFPVIEDDEYAYRIVWARPWEPSVPIDLFITDYQNYALYVDTFYFDYYARYDHIDYVEDTIKVRETEDLYFILDNTEFFGSPPDSTFYCTLSIGKLTVQPFSYFHTISFLNTGSVLTSIEIPDADTLYLVVNNAGYVEGGAVPIGSVEFRLNITEE